MQMRTWELLQMATIRLNMINIILFYLSEGILLHMWRLPVVCVLAGEKRKTGDDNAMSRCFCFFSGGRSPFFWGGQLAKDRKGVRKGERGKRGSKCSTGIDPPTPTPLPNRIQSNTQKFGAMADNIPKIPLTKREKTKTLRRPKWGWSAMDPHIHPPNIIPTNITEFCVYGIFLGKGGSVLFTGCKQSFVEGTHV